MLLSKYPTYQFDPWAPLIYFVSREIQGIKKMAKKPENLSFEESISELERIVSELEQGEVPLDDALNDS